ncbi:hypothetical protein [Nonomuraea sp. LPB2021202275-12-8]|uniref:hypothetical protein n=1 Tax=Nonomuraea sp. LPB2021202275-12-8 TaxID=3120159 RepID=UPI00300D669F
MTSTWAGAAARRRQSRPSRMGAAFGGLRHYFDSQDGLLLFAAEAVASGVGARVVEHLRADLRLLPRGAPA